MLVIQKDTKPPLPTSVNAFMSNQLAWFLKGFSAVFAAMAEPGAVDVALVGPVRQGGPATKHGKLILAMLHNYKTTKPLPVTMDEKL